MINLRFNNIRRISQILISIALITTGLPLSSLAQNWQPESYHYEYNAGPSAAGRSAKQVLELYAAQPENKYISEEISPEQKFRYAFGAMMLRTNYAPNTIKIFAIGQDAVDDAELVKLPGTGTGYSTRVQNIANYHGVDSSLATSNASFQTIKGQYGSFGHPYIEKSQDGEYKISQSRLVDNYSWVVFNSDNSPIVKHRESAWEWEIKNNSQSLRLIILFGGAAQDAFAGFLNKRGFRVPPKIKESRLANIKVPQSKLVYAGGNNEFPVLLTKSGNDLYAELVGRRLDYKTLEDQNEAVAALKNAGPEAIEKMKFIDGGIDGSGIVNAAQLEGYDLNKAQRKVGNKWVETHSLRGLKLSDGTVVDTDIAFVSSPHPTALSNDIAAASDRVTKIFAQVQDLIGGSKAIKPDLDADGRPMVNRYARGEPFKYDRGYLPKRVVPFGAPLSILRPRSSADRLGPQVLVSEPPSKKELRDAGFRSLDEIFDKAKIDAAKKAQPVEPLDTNDIWSQHSRQKNSRYLYDSGPGPEMAKLMVENLDESLLEYLNAPVLGFFAHYRGTFEKPEVLIMHDPVDLEDRNTFRAATGRRGQALNGLMRDLGVEHKQLILATIPADLTDVPRAQLEILRSGTEEYREAILSEVLAQKSIKVIFTDGPIAEFEVARIMKKKRIKIPVINIKRDMNAMSGIEEAGAEAKTLAPFRGASIKKNYAAIPIQHLPWNSRDWERVTSGTVIEAEGEFKGKSYAVVTPDFVFKQDLKPLPETIESVRAIKNDLKKMNIPLVQKRGSRN